MNDFVPNVQFVLKPGMTKYVKLHSEEITADDTKVIDNSGTLQVRVTVHDAYLTVDDCGGPVSARLVGVAQMKTQTSFDELNLYGDILSI